MGYVPLSLGGTYPGLYLFTSPSRFIRPVRNISIPSSDGKDIEHIGPFEQVNTAFLFCRLDPFHLYLQISDLNHVD